jgi:hypothetical protein
MIRIEKSTRLKAVEIIDKASAFFGRDGEGLTQQERGMCCVSFAGGGGYVAVTVVDEDRQRVVDVESREFEYQARQFLNTI